MARGSCRLLWQQGLVPLLEVSLADGHRADIMAIGRGGDILIVEIKVSAADLLGDRKWQHYRDWCDRFVWAVPESLAGHLDAPRFAPQDCGLVVADRHEAVMVREAVTDSLPAARRKAVTLAFARQAALRLHRGIDPAFTGWGMVDAPDYRG